MKIKASLRANTLTNFVYDYALFASREYDIIDYRVYKFDTKQSFFSGRDFKKHKSVSFNDFDLIMQLYTHHNMSLSEFQEKNRLLQFGAGSQS